MPIPRLRSGQACDFRFEIGPAILPEQFADRKSTCVQASVSVMVVPASVGRTVRIRRWWWRDGHRPRDDDGLGSVPVMVVSIDHDTAGQRDCQYHQCDNGYEPFHGHYSFLDSVAFLTFSLPIKGSQGGESNEVFKRASTQHGYRPAADAAGKPPADANFGRRPA